MIMSGLGGGGLGGTGLDIAEGGVEFVQRFKGVGQVIPRNQKQLSLAFMNIR